MLHLLRKSAVLAVALIPGSAAAAAPSSPGNLAMHEFQVGDVFQYRAQGGYVMTMPVTTIGTRKHRIVSKAETPLSRTYVVDVLYRTEGFTDNGPLSVLTGRYLDTLSYLDSSGHGLNGCPGEVVPMPAPGAGRTRVEAVQGDTGWFALASPGLRMKRFRERISNPGEPVVDAPTYAVVYAEGLGAVGTTVGPGLTQPASKEVMTGYIRNGTVTGEVSSDQHLLQTVSIRPTRPRTDIGIRGCRRWGRGRHSTSAAASCSQPCGHPA
jgi:hypothetical protein